MTNQQEQLIKLLIKNAQPVWEIEAIHIRCYIYYGMENALEQCQDIIDFANMAGIGLMESFRLHVEVSELAIHKERS